MGKLIINRRQSRSPQVGDMRERIGLYTRSLTEPDFGEVKMDQDYTLIAEVWAAVQTVKGKKLFAGVQTDDKDITEIFTIRYRSDVTSETIVKFRDDYYKIVKPNDLDRRKRFIELLCTEKGEADKEANW